MPEKIWFCKNQIEELKQVHLKFLKIVLGVNQSTPTAVVLGETGRCIRDFSTM